MVLKGHIINPLLDLMLQVICILNVSGCVSKFECTFNYVMHRAQNVYKVTTNQSN